MTYGVYKVIGKRAYRGHDPGTTFEAIIDPAVEHRAVNRGDIMLLRRMQPDLIPGTFTLPAGWLDAGNGQTNGTPVGVSRMSEGG